MLCILLAFPADIGRKQASPARGSRQRVHTSPVKSTRRLMKRPTAQHGGARMDRDGCVTISRTGVYIYNTYILNFFDKFITVVCIICA